MSKITHRRNYLHSSLEHTDPDPFVQFKLWFEEVRQAFPDSIYNSMVLATSSQTGPTTRIVLLKEITSEGLIFFSNYHSAKGQAIAEHPEVSLLFWWEAFERQIRIQGRAEKTSAAISDEYFYSRPRTYQISALVSEQSQIIANRSILDEKYQQLLAKYADEDLIIPRPENWGGYLIRPHYFEFWQGRADRLHDRIAYNLSAAQAWEKSRLAP